MTSGARLDAPAGQIGARNIADLLSLGRFDLSCETATQADIERFLRDHLPADMTVEREVRLSPADRPDFMVADRILIEVKVSRAPKPGLIRQLLRYAAYERVEALILATNTAVRVPDALIKGKPLFVVSLGRAWL